MNRAHSIFGLSGLFLLLLSLSCEQFAPWKLNPTAETRLVVEAILTDERRTQEIRLSLSHTTPNDSAPAVTDAQVRVEAGGTSYAFLPDAVHPGRYYSETPFEVVDHLEYTLHLEWQGIFYSATSVLAAVGPIPTLRFLPENDSNRLRLANFVEIYSGSQQAMYELTLDWSALSNEEPTRARLYFYSFSDVHINELVRSRREQVSFPRGSMVIIRKYGLNDAFAAYLRSMAIETDWNGFFYFTAAANLPSNISPEAYGFFSTCAVLTDTVVAE